MTGNVKSALGVAYRTTLPEPRIGRRKSGRAYRRAMARSKYARRFRIITGCNNYDPRIGYVKCVRVDGVGAPVGNHIIYPKDSECQRWIKRATSSRVRRYHGLSKKGNLYRRVFDYWWTLY